MTWLCNKLRGLYTNLYTDLQSSPESTTPIANAGPDQSVAVSAVVTLDGSASSDPQNKALTYAWTLTTIPGGSAAVLSSSTAQQPTFTADLVGTYIAELVVNNGTENSTANSVTVTCSNQIPIADAGPDQLGVTVSALVTLDGSGSSDPDMDSITYLWSLPTKPGGSAATLSSTTVVGPTFTADVAGIYIASLTVNDGTDDSDPDTVTIQAGNTAPIAAAGPDQAVNQGTLVTLDGTGSSDPNSDPITYLWVLTTPAGSSSALSSTTASQPTFTPDRPGTYTADLVVNDGIIDSPSDSVTITVANLAPTANAGPDQNVSEGADVFLDGTGSSDPGGDPLTYYWTMTQKPANSYSSLFYSWGVETPFFGADQNGAYIIELVVYDGIDYSAPDTVTVNVANVAPTADAGVDQAVNTGAEVTLNGDGSTDISKRWGGGDTLTYSWSFTAVPSGSAAVLSNSSTISPSFTADLAGTYTVQLEVNDGDDSATDTVDIVAAAAASQPTTGRILLADLETAVITEISNTMAAVPYDLCCGTPGSYEYLTDDSANGGPASARKGNYFLKMTRTAGQGFPLGYTYPDGPGNRVLVSHGFESDQEPYRKDRWWGISVYVPGWFNTSVLSGIPESDPWNYLFGWHGKHGEEPTYFTVSLIHPNRLLIMHRTLERFVDNQPWDYQAQTYEALYSTTCPRDQWIDFVFNSRIDNRSLANGTTGFVKAWMKTQSQQNYTQVINYNGPFGFYHDNIGDIAGYFYVGNYTNTNYPHNRTYYYDEIRGADETGSFDVVDPAWGE